MPLPAFNAAGDLPPGVHRATIEEVVARFSSHDASRRKCTANLLHILDLAKATSQLDRLIVFGSYVSEKASPNDVDIILVMREGFDPTAIPIESRRLFDHAVAQWRFGASVFWLTPSIALGEPVEEFISHWQRKRDGTLRGIVEMIQ